MLPSEHAPTPVAVVAYDATYAELVRLQRGALERAHGGWAAGLLRYGGTAFLVLLGALVIARDAFAGVLTVALLTTVSFVARHRRGPRAIARLRAKARGRGLSAMVEVHVRDADLLVRTPDTDHAVAWGHVIVAERDGDVILGWPPGEIAVPARAFADAAARERFVASVRGRAAAAAAATVEAPAPPGAVAYTHTTADRRAAAYEMVRGTRTPKLLGLVLGGHALMIGASAWVVPVATSLIPFVLFSLLFWLGLLVAPTVVLVEIAVRTEERRSAHVPVRVALDAGAARFGTHTDAVAVPWATVTAIRKASRGLFLRAGLQVYLVPRRAFADTAAFDAFADEAERLRSAARAA